MILKAKFSIYDCPFTVIIVFLMQCQHVWNQNIGRNESEPETECIQETEYIQKVLNIPFYLALFTPCLPSQGFGPLE